MRQTLSFCAAFLVVLLSLGPARPADFDKSKLANIGAGMERFIEDHTIAGAVTVVGSSKGVASLEAIGSSKLDPKTPMTKDSLFKIASMTKPITATGIMILVDEGKLAVNDPVEKHLPEFRGQMLVEERTKDRLTLKKPARAITIKDLLTHTSGLPFYPTGLSDLYAKRNRTLAEGALVISQQPLMFEPGSRWSYCNSGIDVLGRLIEVASGERYESFLAKRIFEPLGMKDTTFYPRKEQRKRVAGLFAKKEGKLVAVVDNLLSQEGGAKKHPVPAGGLYSTGADQARFYRMMLNGGELDGKRILSEKSVKSMTSVQTGELKAAFTPGMGFGYGFAVVRKPEGVTEMLSAGSFGHGGAFGTQAWADPKRDLFVILLIQRTGLSNSDASPMRRELQRLAVEAIKP